MRTTLGRGDWRPKNRIKGLLRYAFIGDSTAYGAGLPFDQTLPAHTERQMNELVPAWPVEAVNLGVSGYNLWNSWLAFKYGPQVYDGIVLVLCNNDAELFSRSYPFVYPKPYALQWEGGHPFGSAVAKCFEDIALFSQERSLPVTVVFFNMWQYQAQLGEMIGALCTSKGLCYLDTFPVLRDRNFTREDLAVSKADFHPSALAHEAVGRHLAMMLKQQRWFETHDTSPIGAVPDRILSTARLMVEVDDYPPDAAMNWASGVLESKSRIARRIEASGGENDFSSASERVTEILTASSRRWHMAHRLRAVLGSTALRNQSVASSLFCGEEERLKLEEISFALGTDDWERLAMETFDISAAQKLVAGFTTSDAEAFFDECGVDLRSVREALDGLRALAASAAIGSTHDKCLVLADLKTFSRRVDKVAAECVTLKSAFQRVEGDFSAVRHSLSDERVAQISGLIGAIFNRAKYSFGFIRHWPGVIDGLRDASHAVFTTVEVTLSTEPMEEKPYCLVTAECEYLVPSRLPFSNNAAFLSDGVPMLVKLYLPLFYEGRLLLRTTFMRAPNKPPVEVKFHKVEVYNMDKRRRAVEVSSLYKDGSERFISPVLYLT